MRANRPAGSGFAPKRKANLPFDGKGKELSDVADEQVYVVGTLRKDRNAETFLRVNRYEAVDGYEDDEGLDDGPPAYRLVSSEM